MSGALRDPVAILERYQEAMLERPARLQSHVRRVEAEARRLASVHELDRDVCAAAAAGHDLFRHCTDEELLELSRRYRVAVSEEERDVPIVLHGPIAAAWSREELGVADEEILSAIGYHTTAHPQFSESALAVFLADKIDPRKVERDAGLRAVAAAAEHDLYAAGAMFLERRLAEQLASGQLLHPLAVASRNAFLRRRS